MRNITRASIALIGAVALTGATALSASAADDTATGATVSIEAGFVTIDAPLSVALDTSTALFAPGTVITGTLTGVTVTDATASTAGWNASVEISDFVTTPATKTIPASSLTYTATTPVNSGPSTATFADVAPVTGGATALIQTATTNGNNAASWNAGLSLAVPADALAGDYTATLTHSVLP